MKPNISNNIVLIGMPWSGKSSTGVVLAKALVRPFVDTDIVIQTWAGRSLQDIIDREGANALRAMEERCLLRLDCRNHVIATGGSVVYSEAAMTHLKSDGLCIYLRLPFSALEARATNIDYRGLVRAPGQTLADLYAERTPLYERYADHVLDCEGCDQGEVLQALLNLLSRAD